MLISTKGRYALRVMIDLAEHQADGFIPLKVIADYPSKLRIDDIAAKTHNEIVPVRFGADGHLEVIQ